MRTEATRKPCFHKCVYVYGIETANKASKRVSKSVNIVLAGSDLKAKTVMSDSN